MDAQTILEFITAIFWLAAAAALAEFQNWIPLVAAIASAIAAIAAVVSIRNNKQQMKEQNQQFKKQLRTNTEISLFGHDVVRYENLMEKLSELCSVKLDPETWRKAIIMAKMLQELEIKYSEKLQVWKTRIEWSKALYRKQLVHNIFQINFHGNLQMAEKKGDRRYELKVLGDLLLRGDCVLRCTKDDERFTIEEAREKISTILDRDNNFLEGYLKGLTVSSKRSK